MKMCPNHPSHEYKNCLRCMIDMLESEIEDQRRMIDRLRDGLQEVYALAGEDPKIEKIASPLIDASRGF